MLKLLIIPTILMAHAAFGEEENKLTSLRIVNGSCLYNGLLIKDKYSDEQNDPCENWSCDASKNQLKIKGCELEDRYGSCVYWNAGRRYWPSCCRYGRTC